MNRRDHTNDSGWRHYRGGEFVRWDRLLSKQLKRLDWKRAALDRERWRSLEKEHVTLFHTALVRAKDNALCDVAEEPHFSRNPPPSVNPPSSWQPPW